MTSPASRSLTPSSFTPLNEGPPEKFREPTTEVREALTRDQSDLQREVILWQRWVRYLALVVILGAVIAFNKGEQVPRIPLIGIAMGYTAIVLFTGLIVQRSDRPSNRLLLRG